MPPTRPYCLVVTGLPGSGKSTLARRLAHHYGVAQIAKDHFKEIVFDSLGWSDRAWSKRVSMLAWEMCFDLLHRLDSLGHASILEGNLGAAQWLRLEPWRARSALIVIECRAPAELLIARAAARARGGVRHPGHVDTEVSREVVAAIDAGANAVPAAVPAFHYDSAQSSGAAASAEFARLIAAIDDALAAARLSPGAT